jgi:hypothetical protein
MLSHVFVLLQIGQVSLSTPGTDDGKSLSECNFAIGDFLDIAVRYGSKGSVP